MGGAGNDIIEGNFSGLPEDFSNVLEGGDGDDVLRVNGNAILIGGNGSDTFILGATGPDKFITDFQHAGRGKDALRIEDVLNVHEVFDSLQIDKPLGALVGQGYLVVESNANVGGDSAADTVVQVDADGRAGSSPPQMIVTLFDTTLATHGQDMNNWLV